MLDRLKVFSQETPTVIPRDDFGRLAVCERVSLNGIRSIARCRSWPLGCPLPAGDLKNKPRRGSLRIARCRYKLLKCLAASQKTHRINIHLEPHARIRLRRTL